MNLRRLWLISTLAYLFIPTITGYFLGGSLNAILSSLLTFGITYWCAYRKPGTRWLTFLLIFGALGFARSVIHLLRSSLQANIILVWAPTQALFIWWYVMNWKLRKFNLASGRRSAVIEISA